MLTSNFSEFQPAYRCGHSTETALLKVVNDIVISACDRQVIVFLSPDISATFVTIDHNIRSYSTVFPEILVSAALPLDKGTYCHITVILLNCWVLSGVTQKPNYLTPLTATVNTQPSFRRHAPLISLWHTALYKCVLIDWLLEYAEHDLLAFMSVFVVSLFLRPPTELFPACIMSTFGNQYYTVVQKTSPLLLQQ